MCGIAAERANEDAGRTRRRPRAGRYGLTLILAVALAVGCVAPASAADPDAPPGASADWLPDEPWVGQHWLPYDEMRLVRSLGMSYKDLRRWMIHRPGPLSRLIRERGLDPGRLARRLVAQSRATASRAMYRELLDRTMRTFTQPHLVRHMFGHPFHQWSWQRRTERIFGVSNLRTFADGTRVLRTLAAERRRAVRHRFERVQMEESARALTPPGGFPAITPEAAVNGTGVNGSRYPRQDGGLAFMEEEAS